MGIKREENSFSNEKSAQRDANTARDILLLVHRFNSTLGRVATATDSARLSQQAEINAVATTTIQLRFDGYD